MGCIVAWQFSLYVVLGVFYSSAVGWWCPIFVDAYNVEGEFTSSSLLSATNHSAPLPMYVSNNTDYEPRLGLAVTTMANNSEDDSLEEQLKDDQVALKRMVTILSLVGVVGAVALVATIVIFTKMRLRKQRINSKISNALDDDDESTTTDQHVTGNENQQRHGDTSDINSISDQSVEDETPVQNTTDINNISSGTDINNGLLLRLPDTDTLEPQPSAPPTTFPPVSTFTTTTTTTLYRHRRTLSIPILQQSAPTPSAPTAKELDHHHQEGPGNPIDLHQQGQYCHSEPTSSMNAPIAVTPDLPPPAYTPNASPLYDRTYQSTNIFNTTTQLGPLRRHSQT